MTKPTDEQIWWTKWQAEQNHKDIVKLETDIVKRLDAIDQKFDSLFDYEDEPPTGWDRIPLKREGGIVGVATGLILALQWIGSQFGVL